MSSALPNMTEEEGTSNTSEPQHSIQKVDRSSRLRSLIVTECGFKITTTENYLKRLQNLRKELNYVDETEWMYNSDTNIIP